MPQNTQESGNKTLSFENIAGYNQEQRFRLAQQMLENGDSNFIIKNFGEFIIKDDSGAELSERIDLMLKVVSSEYTDLDLLFKKSDNIILCTAASMELDDMKPIANKFIDKLVDLKNTRYVLKNFNEVTFGFGLKCISYTDLVERITDAGQDEILRDDIAFYIMRHYQEEVQKTERLKQEQDAIKRQQENPIGTRNSGRGKTLEEWRWGRRAGSDD